MPAPPGLRPRPRVEPLPRLSDLEQEVVAESFAGRSGAAIAPELAGNPPWACGESEHPRTLLSFPGLSEQGQKCLSVKTLPHPRSSELPRPCCLYEKQLGSAGGEPARPRVLRPSLLGSLGAESAAAADGRFQRVRALCPSISVPRPPGQPQGHPPLSSSCRLVWKGCPVPCRVSTCPSSAGPAPYNISL